MTALKARGHSYVVCKVTFCIAPVGASPGVSFFSDPSQYYALCAVAATLAMIVRGRRSQQSLDSCDQTRSRAGPLNVVCEVSSREGIAVGRGRTVTFSPARDRACLQL